MPNFDTGHYFLTTLAPIKSGSVEDSRGVSVSYRQKLRMLLSVLPTALQSPATEQIGINSPFARNRRTHLCRLVVIDDTVYNGRLRSNAILNAITGNDPIQPREVDELNAAYLMFAADFDAVMEEGDRLPVTLSEEEQNKVRDAYACRLWETMEAEIRQIYSNCEGFDNVHDASGFANYLSRCQVETTMPFNDYWSKAPDLPSLPVKGLAAAVLVPLGVTLLCLLGWLFGFSTGLAFLIGAVVTAIAVVGAYRFVMSRGAEPMPPGEYADLPSVLKGLYLQQRFTEFAIDAQGMAEDELHTAFGKFVAEHEPGDKMAPSQRPGVIAIDRQDAIVS